MKIKFIASFVCDKVPRYSDRQQYPPALATGLEDPQSQTSSDLIITKYKANRVTSMHQPQKDRKKDSRCTKTATHAGEWL